MTKGKLFAELRFIPTQELREHTNKVIAENRKLPIEEVKYLKYLRPNEVIIVKEHFGVES